MNNSHESFNEVRKKNQKKVLRDFIKAIKAFLPEQAVLIMGKHVPVEGKDNEYKYTMNITENIVPERYENFLKTLKVEVFRVEMKKAKKVWTPSDQ